MNKVVGGMKCRVKNKQCFICNISLKKSLISVNMSSFPVFRKDSKLDYSNYLSISLLSNIEKILEKLIYKRLCAPFIITMTLFITFFFFLCGFSFTSIHESQDCRGKGREFIFFNSSLPLPPASRTLRH